MRSVSLPDRTLLKYYVYSGLAVWQFIAPINVLFMESKGLSFLEISAVLSAFSLGIVASEIPTGYLGDRIGRRRSLIVGVYLVAASILLYGLASEFREFLAIQIVWTVGITFMSGTNQAWLYETLKQSSDEDRFAHVRGRATALNSAAAAAAIVAGGYLYAIDRFYPFAVATACLSLAGLVLVTFPEPGGDSDGSGYDVGEALALLKHMTVDSAHRGFVFYAAALAGGFAIVGGVYVQPMARDLGIAEQYIGWLFAAATGIGVVANAQAGRIKERIGVVRWFRATPIAVGVVMALVVALPILIVPAFLLARGWNRVSRPLRNQYLNDHVASSENRATVISAVSMGVSLFESGFLFATGFVSDAASASVAVGSAGVALAVLVAGFVGLGLLSERPA